MELQAVLLSTSTIESGTNKNGEPWQKTYAMFETMERYPKQVAISMMGKLCENITKTPKGTLCKIKFDAESREYNGRYYTELRAWSFSNVATDLMQRAQDKEASRQAAQARIDAQAGQQQPQQPQQPQQQQQPPTQPYINEWEPFRQQQ